MGWSFTQGQTKKELVAWITEQTADDGTKACSHHKTLGNSLWAIFSDKNEDSFIMLFLLQSDKGYGWGYKSICESSHPYYFNCPLEYFEIVPTENAEWRKKVIEHHSKAKEQKENLKTVLVQMEENPDDSYIVLPKGYTPRYSKFVGFVPNSKSVFATSQSLRYKLTPKYLKVAQIQTLEWMENTPA